MNNSNLQKAKIMKNDEFYTKEEDVTKELINYSSFFKNKKIYCNCDNPLISEFWKYFFKHFDELLLRSLTATYYAPNQAHTFLTKYDSRGLERKVLNNNGDFRSSECIEILKQSDIVITNPPFSLFRDYMSILMEYNKKFLIIGNMNAVTYKDIFPLLKENKIWLGYTKPKSFISLNGESKKFGNILWFTNLPVSKRDKKIDIYNNHYNLKQYPKYDNYSAIEVSKTADIPCDYNGIMGVPISFIEKYCPEQFKIIGVTESEGIGLSNGLWDSRSKTKQPTINGKRIYKRLFIQSNN